MFEVFWRIQKLILVCTCTIKTWVEVKNRKILLSDLRSVTLWGYNLGVGGIRSSRGKARLKQVIAGGEICSSFPQMVFVFVFVFVFVLSYLLLSSRSKARLKQGIAERKICQMLFSFSLSFSWSLSLSQTLSFGWSCLVSFSADEVRHASSKWLLEEKFAIQLPLWVELGRSGILPVTGHLRTIVYRL